MTMFNYDSPEITTLLVVFLFTLISVIYYVTDQRKYYE